jgi:curved DNA-binding protein CbpA
MDAFFIMGVPRAPWLDEADLKERFHRLSASRHPDIVGGDSHRFAELNDAYRILGEPVSRLRHFLQLTAPDSIVNAAAIPQEMGDLFMDVAAATQEAQKFAAAREKAASPLARALMEPQRLEIARRLAEMEGKVETAFRAIETEIRVPDATAQFLGGLLSRYTFLGNWRRQLKEIRVNSGV